jgi:hypothetical protein
MDLLDKYLQARVNSLAATSCNSFSDRFFIVGASLSSETFFQQGWQGNIIRRF